MRKKERFFFRYVFRVCILVHVWVLVFFPSNSVYFSSNWKEPNQREMEQKKRSRKLVKVEMNRFGLKGNICFSSAQKGEKKLPPSIVRTLMCIRRRKTGIDVDDGVWRNSIVYRVLSIKIPHRMLFNVFYTGQSRRLGRNFFSI